MKNKLIKIVFLAIGLVTTSQSAISGEDQDALLKKLEEKGISIGGLSDDPHRDRDDVVLSEAEKLLWETDQLANVDKTGVIRYEFERKSSLDDGFTDTVELNILEVKEDGMKSASANFFTGDRNQTVAPNENTNGNPILGVYLQGDVYEMNRLTEGSWRYFHKRIKFALADDAEIKKVKITFDGKELDAKKVTIQPYANDPKRKMFEQYADKIYEITVSEDIPGMLYKIRTVIPAVAAKKGEEASSKEPQVVETLIFAGADFD